MASRPVRAGDRAPSFSLSSDDGTVVALADVLAKGPAVVFFYPKDETAGCTAEACAFRDAYEAFQEAGATVIGISSDSAASHGRFRHKHGFQFLLLSDPGGRVRAEWGVPKTLGLLDGRSTYVIGKDGVVSRVFHSQVRVKRHVEEALTALKKLA
jgi:peroxiredoxin Q/BCP